MFGKSGLSWEFRDFQDIPDFLEILEFQQIRDVLGILDFLDIRDFLEIPDVQEVRDDDFVGSLCRITRSDVGHCCTI